MQQHTAEVVERYQRMVDRMRKELPRFHDETARELGNAFRVCAEMQVRRLLMPEPRGLGWNRVDSNTFGIDMVWARSLARRRRAASLRGLEWFSV